jgi:leucyl aminopeptidase
MALELKIEFDRFKAPGKGVLIVFCDDALRMGAATRKLLGDSAGLVARAAEADGFTGKSGSTLDIIAPSGLKAVRLVVIGCGKASDLKTKDFLKLGGVAAGKVPATAKQATIVAELPAAAMSPDAIVGVATGATLRAYSFDRYKTKKKEGEDKRTSL